VRNADAAMYKAKRAGKARYEIYESGDNPSPLTGFESGTELSIRRSKITGKQEDQDLEGDREPQDLEG
jgi:hypothetical protein